MKVCHTKTAKVGTLIRSTKTKHYVELESGKKTWWPADKCKKVIVGPAALAKAKKIKGDKTDPLDIPDFLIAHPDDSKHKVDTVQLIITNESRRTAREFKKAADAIEYLKELGVDPSRTTSKTSDNRGWQLESGLSIYCNRPLPSVLSGKLKGPAKDIIFVAGLNQSSTRSAISPNVKKALKGARKPKTEGSLISLKALCKDINVDPRKARQKLRKLAASGKIEHDGRWEWSPAEVDKIKELLA